MLGNYSSQWKIPIGKPKVLESVTLCASTDCKETTFFLLRCVCVCVCCFCPDLPQRKLSRNLMNQHYLRNCYLYASFPVYPFVSCQKIMIILLVRCFLSAFIRILSHINIFNDSFCSSFHLNAYILDHMSWDDISGGICSLLINTHIALHASSPEEIFLM